MEHYGQFCSNSLRPGTADPRVWAHFAASGAPPRRQNGTELLTSVPFPRSSRAHRRSRGSERRRAGRCRARYHGHLRGCAGTRAAAAGRAHVALTRCRYAYKFESADHRLLEYPGVAPRRVVVLRRAVRQPGRERYGTRGATTRGIVRHLGGAAQRRTLIRGAGDHRGRGGLGSGAIVPGSRPNPRMCSTTSRISGDGPGSPRRISNAVRFARIVALIYNWWSLFTR